MSRPISALPVAVKVRAGVEVSCRRAALVGALLAVVGAVASCGASSATTGRPQATLADSAAAQEAFRALRARFFANEPGGRRAMKDDLLRFLDRYSSDSSARVVRAYLGWVLTERGELVQAQKQFHDVRVGPTGSARDLATVGEAMLLRRIGHSAQALSMLTPLRDKIIDPDERLLFGAELVQSALAERRWSLSIDAMLEWLGQAPAEVQQALEKQVRAWLRRVPTEDLVTALENLDRDAATASGIAVPAREWTRRTIRSALARTAVTSKDSALARRLLDGAPAAFRAGREGTELARIAASGSIAPRIAGRAVGLVVGIGDPETRRRSAAAAAGMSRAFSQSTPDAGDVRLIVIDDGGDADGLRRGLESLAGEGAAVLVAGFEPAGAALAARYAEDAKIPVMVLADSGHAVEPHHFTFDLGADPETIATFGEEQLQRRGANHVVRVGPGGVSCEGSGVAGQTKFPVNDWKKDKVDGLLLMGDATCSLDAVREVSQSGAKAMVLLGLEAGEHWRDLSAGVRVLAVRSGRFPSDVPPAITGAPDPSWYEVLGHDAAELARTALATLPAGEESDSRAVAELHARVQAALASSHVALWSSDASGFDSTGHLPRILDIADRTAKGSHR